MRTNCEGCAGCCVDWRPLVDDPDLTERASRRPPLDDVYNLAPLTRDEISGFVDRDLADALTPRLFEPAAEDETVVIDGRELAAVDGRPVFMIGLRKPPKPVGPFGEVPRWLPTCVFLDPETLQCRIHEDDVYPQTCATYPGHNLRLGAETECERVEAAFGGDRLLDASIPEDLPPPQFGPTALGTTVFAYPDPDELAGVAGRLSAGTNTEPTGADRARFIGAAVGSRPMSLEVNRDRMSEARAAAERADSWVGQAVAEWEQLGAAAGGVGGDVNEDAGSLANRIEEKHGAPDTPGW